MEADFWHNRWERGEIGFHEGKANPLLVAYFKKLHLKNGCRVFIPLCGKTLDIAWLLAGGYQVVGAELSKLAIDELFQSLCLQPTIVQTGALMHYSANDIDIYVGDIFDLTTQTLGKVHAIYDRAAIVALPAETRKHYAAHLMNITHSAPQLVIAYEYDQSLMNGPPFSVSEVELQRHYGASYSLAALETKEVEGAMKNKTAATETIWLLKTLADQS